MRAAFNPERVQRIVLKPIRAFRRGVFKAPPPAPDLDDTLSLLEAPVTRPRDGVWLANGDCLDVLGDLCRSHASGLFDAVVADVPADSTCVDEIHFFNQAWIDLCRRLLRPHGTLWVSGAPQVILSAGYALQQAGMTILNTITWERPSARPGLSRHRFAPTTETLLWAAPATGTRHVFDEALVRERLGGRARSVWRMRSPSAAERAHGRHPSQKPEPLVRLCLEASTLPGALVLDPFLGSGTTAVAAAQTGRRCLGIETDPAFLAVAEARVRAASRME
jgi:site-specific DNA-methyltransferase (adenine-specific)